jgi:hypothetical protein
VLEKSNKLEFSYLLCRRFADVAAQTSRLDVVISMATSVAQLAAALGCKLWVLLAFAADFRWPAERSASAWNSTATIFTQEKPGDLGAVLAAINRMELGR